MSAAALLMRRVRSEGAILLLLFVLAVATSFLFAAAPRLLNRVSDDAVRYAVAHASPVDRDIWLYANGFITAGTDTGASVVGAYGAQRQADFPPSINSVISGRFQGATTARFLVPQSIVVLSLRYQDGLTDASRLVEGRWPVDRQMPLKTVRVGQPVDPSTQAAPTVFEAALSTTQAEFANAHVGDRFAIGLDGSDPLVPKTANVLAPTEIEIVGIYEPLDPSAPTWAGSGLIQPSFKQGPDGIQAIYTTAYVPAESYPRLAAGGLPFHYDWHFQVDPALIDADQAATLQTDLQRLDLIVAPTDDTFLADTSSTVSVNSVSIGTGLLGIIDEFAAQRARSKSVLSIAALGLLGLAAGATAMLAILLVRRRRFGLLLARGRGASGRLLLGAELLEAIVLAGIAALLGLLLAVIAVPARDTPLSPILAFVVALVTRRSARRPRRGPRRGDR